MVFLYVVFAGRGRNGPATRHCPAISGEVWNSMSLAAGMKKSYIEDINSILIKGSPERNFYGNVWQ